MKFQSVMPRPFDRRSRNASRRLRRAQHLIESLEERTLMTVLLHTSLDNASSIVAPEIGGSGSSSLVPSDFTSGQTGNGALFTVPGQFVSYPAVDGANQHIDLDKGEIEFWYRPDYEAEDESLLRQLVLVGSAYDVPRLAITHWDRLSLSVFTSDWVEHTASGEYRADLWDAGDWVHIRGTWDNSHPIDSLQLYVNGERIDSRGAAGGWDLGDEAAIGNIHIGAGNSTGDHFSAKGVIDELIIHDAPQLADPADGNIAPELLPIGNFSMDLGESLIFTANAIDANGDSLTFTLDEAPDGATIDPDSGAFRWVPSEQQGPGSYQIIVRVTDDGSPNRSVTETVSVRIVDPDAVGITDPTVVVQVAEIPLPEVGVPFVDPTFGTTVRRVSNTSDTGGWESQIYNQLQAFSLNDEYLLLASSEGYVVRRVDDLSQVAGLNTDDWNVPRWHPTLPNVIVHYDSNADATLRVQQTNVETLTTTTVYTFPARFATIVGDPSFEELSRDGRWMAGLATRTDGTSVIFSVDLENLVLGVERPLADFYDGACQPDPTYGILSPDWIGVSPLGNYLAIQWTRDGTELCSGLETYNIETGEFVGRVTDHRRHGDLGIAKDGMTEVFMTTEFNAPPPFDSNFPTTTIHELPGPATGVSPAQYLQTVPWSDEDHYSMQGPDGVGLVSWGNFDQNETIDAPFEDELFLQNDDGSVQRLVHHRSSVCGYWVQPRATLSRDGRYVVYASDWGRRLDCPRPNSYLLGRGDPFIIDLRPEEDANTENSAEDVLIRGANWVVEPVSLVNDDTTHPLGWVNLDTIDVVFDGPIPDENSLTIVGVENGLVPLRFDGIDGSVATWSVDLNNGAIGLSADTYLVGFGESTFDFEVLPGNTSISPRSERFVDIIDLLAVARVYGQESDERERADLNGDGVIAIDDVWAVVRRFGDILQPVDEAEYLEWLQFLGSR